MNVTKAALMEELAQKIAAADHDYALTYGQLHIVIADFNLATHHVEWCLADENQQPDKPLTDLEREIGRDFLLMSMEDRNTVLERAEELAMEAKP